MISIKEKEQCCGCTACANICPSKAIKMEEDNEGFLYPKIDLNKCIKCNLCEKVCPIKNPCKNEKIQKAYSTRVKDEEILKTSTSGGFFTPISEWVLKNDGIVIGVAYSKNSMIQHIKIEKNNKEELALLRGSKYVQSYLGNTFLEVKEFLNKGKTVLFSGTPCQVQGLIKFLDKKYENLITVDVICRGVSSPRLWKLYVEYQQQKNKSKIKEVYFRNKTYGYHSGTMKLVFENNKKYYGSGRVDYMLKSYFSEISSRPSCHKCAFKSKKHISDFTIFDCWNIGKLVDGMKDDDKGYTNVFVNTKKGEEVLEKIDDKLEIYDIDVDGAILLDGIMVENSATPNKNRNKFFDTLRKKGIQEAANQYLNITIADKLFESSKSLLYKTKLLNRLKSLKK